MHKIIVQNAAPDQPTPSSISLRRWAKAALRDHRTPASLTIRVVTSDEMIALNHQYRKKSSVTNVLSFPCEMPNPHEDIDYLGDIAVCAEVVNQEARDQQKTIESHWAHMMIHGTLHLLGYDHVHDDDAIIMETIEIECLADLGYPNPYLMKEAPYAHDH